MGLELRNEIRPVVKGAVTKLPTWGSGDKATDWRLAAERAGAAVQAVHPELLVVVGGLNFGLDLSGANAHPVRLPLPRKLVYSAHCYSWSCPECRGNGTAWAQRVLEKWGYLVAGAIAPVWLAEIGTHHAPYGYDEAGAAATTAGLMAAARRHQPEGGGSDRGVSREDVLAAREGERQAWWWGWLTRHVTSAYPGLGFGYWPLDGTQSPGRTRRRGAEEEYGLLGGDWRAPHAQGHLDAVKRLIDAPRALLRPRPPRDAEVVREGHDAGSRTLGSAPAPPPGGRSGGAIGPAAGEL